MKHFKESPTLAELSNDDWLALFRDRSSKQKQMGVAEVRKRFYFSLILNTQFSIFDQRLNFELFNSHIIMAVLGSIYYGSCTLTNLLHILELGQFDLEGVPSFQLVIQKLDGQVFIRVGVRDEAVVLGFNLLSAFLSLFLLHFKLLQLFFKLLLHDLLLFLLLLQHLLIASNLHLHFLLVFLQFGLGLFEFFVLVLEPQLFVLLLDNLGFNFYFLLKQLLLCLLFLLLNLLHGLQLQVKFFLLYLRV